MELKFNHKAGILLAALLLTGMVGGSSKSQLTLDAAIRQGVTGAAEVKAASLEQQKALKRLKSLKADPTTLITTLTDARQQATLRNVMVSDTRLRVTQQVIEAYGAAQSAQEDLRLKGAQVQLEERNLAIAQARLRARLATPLDVSRAQTNLSARRASLTELRGRLPLLQARLGRLLGQRPTAVQALQAMPAGPRVTCSQGAAEPALERRLPTLVEATQAVEVARLLVSISNNDYTPRQTLDSARTALATALERQTDGRRLAVNSLREAFEGLEAARAQVRVAQQQLTDAQSGARQMEAKVRAGTAAPQDLQSAQVASAAAQFALLQARGTQWNALADLSVAAGTPCWTV